MKFHRAICCLFKTDSLRIPHQFGINIQTSGKMYFKERAILILCLVYGIIGFAEAGVGCSKPYLGTQNAYVTPQKDSYDDFDTVYFWCNDTVPYVSVVAVCYMESWLPPLPMEVCPDPCPVPVDDGLTYTIESGLTNGITFTHGSELLVDCAGSEDGPTSTLCNDGTWEPPPYCQDPCPAPTTGSDVHHADKSTGVTELDEYLPKIVVVYTCVDTTDVLDGPSETTCKDGVWDPDTIPVCRVGCTAPPTVRENGWFKHGATVFLTCEPGMVLNGESPVTCNDGIWSSNTSCSDPPTTEVMTTTITTAATTTTETTTLSDPVDCLYPELGDQLVFVLPHQPHGYLNYDTVYIYCNETLPYVSDVALCFNGDWLPPLPPRICEDACPTPTVDGLVCDKLSGQTDGVIFTHGSLISCSCLGLVSTPSTNLCSNGAWTPAVDEECPEDTTQNTETPLLSHFASTVDTLDPISKHSTSENTEVITTTSDVQVTSSITNNISATDEEVTFTMTLSFGVYTEIGPPITSITDSTTSATGTSMTSVDDETTEVTSITTSSDAVTISEAATFDSETTFSDASTRSNTATFTEATTFSDTSTNVDKLTGAISPSQKVEPKTTSNSASTSRDGIATSPSTTIRTESSLNKIPPDPWPIILGSLGGFALLILLVSLMLCCIRMAMIRRRTRDKRRVDDSGDYPEPATVNIFYNRAFSRSVTDTRTSSTALNEFTGAPPYFER